jgi:hypothetical protein
MCVTVSQILGSDLHMKILERKNQPSLWGTILHNEWISYRFTYKKNKETVTVFTVVSKEDIAD